MFSTANVSRYTVFVLPLFGCKVGNNYSFAVFCGVYRTNLIIFQLIICTYIVFANFKAAYDHFNSSK